MAKAKRFTVTLYPAHRSKSGMIGFSFMIATGTYPKREITAEGAADAVSQAAAFAAEHGEACHASVRCLDKPKPPGFDVKTRHLYYNMDKAPVQ